MSMFDRLLATALQRRDARLKATESIREHGPEAEAVLRAKLAHPDRRKSRRVLRLAIEEVRKKRSNG
jgi:hypothetical protein